MPSPGDQFSFPLTATEWLSGRVLLDVTEQCIKPRRLPADSPLAFFNGALLVEIYATPTTKPTPGEGARLIPSVFIAGGFDPTWHSVGHRKVDLAALDFPAALVMRGIKPYLCWGELQLPTTLTWEDADRLQVSSSTYNAGYLAPTCLVMLGRASELDPAKYPRPQALSLAASDLRMSPEGRAVFSRAGLPEQPVYFDEALARGCDPRRFFA